MPLFSCFTPFGLMEFSSEPSEGEKIYGSMRNAYIDPQSGRAAFDLSAGTHAEAKLYATAMAIAAAEQTTTRAGNNLRPSDSYELLIAHGDRYGVRPRTRQSVKSYRDEVDLAARYPRGARREFMVNGLRAILGTDNLLDYRITAHSEAQTWPATPANGPGVFSRSDVPSKVVRLKGPVTPASFPASLSVAYENWDTTEPETLISKGDVLCIEPENIDQAEKVTVTAADGAGDDRRFTAIFTKSHDQHCAATTGPVPIWFSTRRVVLIVVRDTAALVPDLVRRVDEFMRRNSRSVTQWAIVRPTADGATTIGPFTLGLSPLGAVTVGEVDFVPMPESGYITPPAGDALLLESGDYLLLENGDRLLLE